MSGRGREMDPDGYLEWMQTKSIGPRSRVDFMGTSGEEQ